METCRPPTSSSKLSHSLLVSLTQPEPFLAANDSPPEQEYELQKLPQINRQRPHTTGKHTQSSLLTCGGEEVKSEGFSPGSVFSRRAQQAYYLSLHAPGNGFTRTKGGVWRTSRMLTGGTKHQKEREANAAPVVQEDGKTPESKPAEAEQPTKNANANSETVNSEVVDKDGTAVNNEVVDNKETVNNDTAAGAEEAEAADSGEAAAPQSSENTSSTEPKTSFLDSFLNKSGLGKVMGGRKKKEQSSTATGGEENAAEGGEKEGEKGAEEAAAADGGAEGGAEGDAAIEKASENGEKEEEKKAEKSKPAEAKSTVRDLIRKPVARIFSHRSTEKKDGAAEPQKQVKVRSKSLDRLEDAEALNTTADSTIEEGGAAGGTEGGVEGEQKASSSSATTKHMKRWHSFKKLMAQKAHKKSGGGGEDGKEEGADGEGGGDSSTLDSKESGQKRWKLKRSWTFQGLKRDPSMVGISGKAKGSDKDSADKPEEGAAGVEEGEEAKPDGDAEEAKTEGGEEKAEGGEEEKAAAAGGGTVTQHANEIWTSFKKRVIPKSKRANTECAPSAEDDAAAATGSGEEGAAEEGKDAKSAKAKRSHFGRAVSLKNFILRKGKSTSVDMGEGAKEEEEATEAAEGVETAEEAGAEGEAANKESNDKDAAEKTAEEAVSGEEAPKEAAKEAAKEPEKTPVEAPVTNGENGCSNGTGEEHATHNHQDEEKTTGSSPVKKSKEAGGAKEEANAKIINATAAVNSDKKAGNV
ncbi:golgin subfamily A member 6-like protein 2 [Xyrichtys novacula]|uniref:Golgin subfamily A member 6-like protein 2 n=1 Tax=Xyrichtys novacula TaxID=13765 RepID=A0AAV1G1E2_XYRNO|nr:golgin subfamily A member 6-like protein 2 [Xyrichtys novacula]